MSEGFIALHRKIERWEWYKDGNTLRVFLHLLLNANHQDGRWKGIEIKRGQLITGRNKIANITGLTPKNIRTALFHLKSTNEVAIKATNKYSLITVVNYDSYQFNEIKRPAKRPAIGPARGQQVATNNNDNNVNNKYSTEFLESISVYNRVFNKNIHPTNNRKSKYRARSKRFRHAEILKAIENFALDDWEDRHKYNEYERVLKNDESCEKWLNYKPKQSSNRSDFTLL